MLEHYKRLVQLVIEMHAEQATEDGTYNPQGSELEAILLAHQIDERQKHENSLREKQQAAYDDATKQWEKFWESTR